MTEPTAVLRQPRQSTSGSKIVQLDNRPALAVQRMVDGRQTAAPWHGVRATTALPAVQSTATVTHHPLRGVPGAGCRTDWWALRSGRSVTSGHGAHKTRAPGACTVSFVQLSVAEVDDDRHQNYAGRPLHPPR